jgi:hypothetical protein
MKFEIKWGDRGFVDGLLFRSDYIAGHANKGLGELPERFVDVCSRTPSITQKSPLAYLGRDLLTTFNDRTESLGSARYWNSPRPAEKHE